MTAQHIPEPSARTFADELSGALHQSGLTLETVTSRLTEMGTPVSQATLSYWQTGRSLPRRASSIKALTNLETVLGLPQGALLQCLPSHEARRVEPQDVRPALPLLIDVIEQMDFHESHWRGIAAADHVVVGANHSEQSLLSEQHVTIVHDGVRVMPAIYVQDADHPVQPLVTPVRGCSLGQVVHVPEHRAVVAELVLPRPMARGERCHVAYRVDCEPTTMPSLRWERALMSPHTLYTATATFEGEAPRMASAYYVDKALDWSEISAEDPLLPGETLSVDGGFLQSLVPDARSGVHGVSWRW